MPLQTGVSVPAVLGTLALLALFLSATAHLAARNVLGDVPVKAALFVGPLPATVAVVGGALELPPAVTLPVALALDFLVVRWTYDLESRTAAYVTFIHVVITVLLSVVVGGIVLLLASRPA